MVFLCFLPIFCFGLVFISNTVTKARVCWCLSEGGTDIFVMTKRRLRVVGWWGMAVGELVSCVLQRNTSEKQRLFFGV